MKAWVLFLISALVFSPEFAHSSELQCIEAGKRFGPAARKFAETLDYCFRLAVARAKVNRKLYARNSSGSLRIFGYNNMVYIQRNSALSIISGNMSMLHDIRSIAVSPDGDSIAVLNGYIDKKGASRQNLLFFKTIQNGNVVPFSINTESSMDVAQSVVFNNRGDEVLLPVVGTEKEANKDVSEIASFKVRSDSRSPLEKMRPRKSVVLDSLGFGITRLTSVSMTGSELLVLDQSKGLLAFSLVNKSSVPSWVVTPSDLKLNKLSHLYYNHATGLIYIFDSTGRHVALRR